MKEGCIFTLVKVNLSMLCTMLTVLFIGLKLGDVINWSWWWVVSPLWLPGVLGIAAYGIIFALGWLLFRNTRRFLKYGW